MEKIKILIEKLGLPYSLFLTIYLSFMVFIPIIYKKKMALHGLSGFYTVTTVILAIAVGQKIWSIRKL